MRSKLFITATLMLGIACAQNVKEKKNTKDSFTNSNSKLNENSIKSFQVKGRCAVFYSPDSIEIEHLKNKIGEDNFYGVVDDNNYYNSEAMKILESKNIKIIITDNRYIEFIKDNGQTTLLDKKSFEAKWGVILFDGKKEPLSVNPVEIAPDVEKYFQKIE
jgi:hypothetical protein